MKIFSIVDDASLIIAVHEVTMPDDPEIHFGLSVKAPIDEAWAEQITENGSFAGLFVMSQENTGKLIAAIREIFGEDFVRGAPNAKDLGISELETDSKIETLVGQPAPAPEDYDPYATDFEIEIPGGSGGGSDRDPAKDYSGQTSELR